MKEPIALIYLKNGRMQRPSDPTEAAAAELATQIAKLIVDTAESRANPLDGIASLLIACDAIASVVAQKCPIELQAPTTMRLTERLVGSIKDWTDEIANAPQVS